TCSPSSAFAPVWRAPPPAGKSGGSAMLEVDHPADMKAHVGKTVGVSDWVLVDQKIIDAFANAIGDHQWIHVDLERAKREMPGGKTIAHGFLTLSLLPRLSAAIYRIRKSSRGIN